eukprot:scaffold22559_cov111-Cylindrotheca_fusiformis.AAC.18
MQNVVEAPAYRMGNDINQSECFPYTMGTALVASQNGNNNQSDCFSEFKFEAPCLLSRCSRQKRKQQPIRLLRGYRILGLIPVS